MIFTTEMIQLFAVVLAKDAGTVTHTLLEEGCMQFIKTSEYQGAENSHISSTDINSSLEEISELRKRVESFLHACSIIPAVPIDADIERKIDINIKKENNQLDQLASQRQGIREKQRSIHQEILKLEDIKRQMELYGNNLSGLKIPEKSSLISMQIGQIPVQNIKQLEAQLEDHLSLSVPIAIEDNIAHRLLITLKRDRQQINTILTKSGFKEVDLPIKLNAINKTVFDQMSAKLADLQKKQKQLETDAENIVRSEADRLKKIWLDLRINELFLKIQANFESSSRTVVFTGWLPASKKQRITKNITLATKNRCYLEWNTPNKNGDQNDQVPVQFNNPEFLAPFQMLVSNFGIPQYGTIDPTPFVMPIYLAMFGLMFADLGQGIVLAIVGLFSALRLKKKQKNTPKLNLAWLITWCGLSSIIFGLLFGSFFGYSTFKPIWFDFHAVVAGHSSQSSVITDIYSILAITIYFGIAVIALGLLFNWINLIRTRQWANLFLDKGGILGGWIYGGGVYIAAYFIAHNYKLFPSPNITFTLVVLPAILLFIKEPYEFYKHKSSHPDNELGIITILNFMMHWTVELLEIFSGYLSNTLSFMRVAGLGIAHVTLMISFFTLAKMTSGINAVLILIVGNILVICLEGLTAAIQALRLSYYEFFTKFFHGTGKLYNPISLNSKFK